MSDITTAPTSDGMPAEGFVRLRQFVGKGKPIPISPSTWWEWVRIGKAPKPVKLSANATAWDVQQVRDLIAELKKSATTILILTTVALTHLPESLLT